MKQFDAIMGKFDTSEPAEASTPVTQQENAEIPPENAIKLSVNMPIAHENNVREEEFALLRTPVIKLTRRQLYDEIWKISVAGVAKKYGIIYAHLMKQVKEANIPIPSSGYWTKLNCGKPVTKLELSEPFDEVVSIFDAAPKRRKAKPKETQKTKVSPEPLPKNEKVEEQPAPAVPAKDGSVTAAETMTDTQTSQEPKTVEQYGQTIMCTTAKRSIKKSGKLQ
jgi:transposase-like protein